MKISFLNFYPIKSKPKDKTPRPHQSQTADRSDVSYNQNLSPSYIAQVTYKKHNRANKSDLRKVINSSERIKFYTDRNFYSKFDYENGQEHIYNLRYLIANDSDFGYGKAFKNGYFYSKEGLEAFKILKETYSPKQGKNRSMLDIALGKFSPSEVLIANKRKLFDSTNKNSLTDMSFVHDRATLPREDFLRLRNSGLEAKKISYCSTDENINNLFKELSKEKIYRPKKWYELLEKSILNGAKDKPDNTGEICKKMLKVKNKKLIFDLTDTALRLNKTFDAEFAADNIENVYFALNSKIKNYTPNSFFGGFSETFLKLNRDNIGVFEELINVKDMSQDLLEKTADYLYCKENIDYVSDLAKGLKSSARDYIELPPYKYAKINERVSALKESKIAKKGESKKEGAIFYDSDDVYIRHNSKDVKISLDKDTFFELFPPFETGCIMQGEGTGDCYFLTGGLISLWKNDKARHYIFDMFKQDGNDIIVTIPKFKDYPVRFKNGQTRLTNHCKSSKGNLMLEEAYAISKCAQKERIKNTDTINPDIAMQYIDRGRESDVFEELTGRNNAVIYTTEDNVFEDKIFDILLKDKKAIKVSDSKMVDLLNNLSLEDNLACASTKQRDEGTRFEYGITPTHSYAIEKIDKQNKTITVVNPYNTFYTAEISYDDFVKYFSSISIMEI